MKLPDFLSKRPEPKKLCRTQNLKRRFNFSFTISRTRPSTSSHGRIGFLQYLSPFTTWPIRYLLRLACFSHFFCGAEGLRGTFPGYPRPPSLFFFFWTTQHEYNNTQHPWEAHPAWDSNPADLVVVSLFLPPPYRQSLINIHTHSWPGGGSFLRKNPPPSVGFEPTSAGTATSKHCLRQPCGHRAYYLLLGTY
jgi:hypothetical protein